MARLLFRYRFIAYAFIITFVVVGYQRIAPPAYQIPLPKTVEEKISAFGQMVLSAHTTAPSASIQYTAWIPDWDYENGKALFILHATSFSQVNPVWYQVDEKGNLKANTHAGDKEFQTKVKSYGVSFVPAIQAFDVDSLHETLKTTDTINRHVAQIIDQVLKYELDGVDLDYEMIYLKDKNNFYTFLDHLSQELKKRDKKLAIDVLAKTSDEAGSYNSLVETRQVQDWSILTRYVDEIRIMAYDYDNSNPDGSPIAPYNWDEAIAKYAVTKSDSQKFILGIPLYAYSWKNGEIYKSYTYEVVRDGLKERGIEGVFDDTVKEWHVRLPDPDGVQTVWYEDARTVGARLDLVKKYNLGGAALWRLGGEDRSIYSLLH